MALYLTREEEVLIKSIKDNMNIIVEVFELLQFLDNNGSWLLGVLVGQKGSFALVLGQISCSNHSGNKHAFCSSFWTAGLDSKGFRSARLACNSCFSS